MLMADADYRESLRRLKPRVFVDGRSIDVRPPFVRGVLVVERAREEEKKRHTQR